jgi:dCTP deaminase
MLNAAEILDLTNQPDGVRIAPNLNKDITDKGGVASIDLRLGCWFIQLRRERYTGFHFDEHQSKSEDEVVSKTYVPLGETYVLHPNSFVLASTLEWLKLPANLGGYVTGKSSLGRRGLVIETAPGVHPQFMGCLTLELANVGEVPLSLQTGMPICQLFLHRITSTIVTEAATRFRGERQPKLGTYKVDGIAEMLALTRPRPK